MFTMIYVYKMTHVGRGVASKQNKMTHGERVRLVNKTIAPLHTYVGHWGMKWILLETN